MIPMKKSLIMVVFLVILLLGLLFYKRPVTKTGFVTNVTTERSENPLFFYEIIKYPSNVEIISKESTSARVGIVGDPWNLNFGIFQPGINGKRFLNLANFKEQPYHVRLVSYGNISRMISFSENDFILYKGDEKKITVFLNSSLSIGPGNYTGEIDIISESTKIPYLGKILWRIQ